jgi:hypothetical protein
LKLNEARRHHREIGHHWRMFKKAVECFHQLDDCDIRAGVDELMISVRGVGPAPRVGESVELRLAYLSALLSKQNVVICIRIKRRVEIDEIYTRVGKFFPVGKPFEIVAEIQTIHSGKKVLRLRSE